MDLRFEWSRIGFESFDQVGQIITRDPNPHRSPCDGCRVVARIRVPIVGYEVVYLTRHGLINLEVTPVRP